MDTNNSNVDLPIIGQYYINCGIVHKVIGFGTTIIKNPDNNEIGEEQTVITSLHLHELAHQLPRVPDPITNFFGDMPVDIIIPISSWNTVMISPRNTVAPLIINHMVTSQAEAKELKRDYMSKLTDVDKTPQYRQLTPEETEIHNIRIDVVKASIARLESMNKWEINPVAHHSRKLEGNAPGSPVYDRYPIGIPISTSDVHVESAVEKLVDGAIMICVNQCEATPPGRRVVSIGIVPLPDSEFKHLMFNLWLGYTITTSTTNN